MILLATFEDVVFHIANVLRIPVLVAAVVALAVVLAESGALIVEIVRRRRRSPRTVEAAARAARAALATGDKGVAGRHLAAIASSGAMWAAIERILGHAAPGPEASSWMAKSLADFDLQSMRRLERTRVLVRLGPALGLMGTLIPLSPALSGLAKGNVNQLTANLRVAFSVTVLGLLVGAVAFGVSLIRDRLYAQDLSDLEAIAAEIERGLNPA